MRKVNSEFAGLKSKMYSLIDVGNKENSKATGVNINKRHKNILMFCLIKKIIKDIMKRIQSHLHRIKTFEVCKISLSCFNDKRYILENGITTVAYFHKDVFKNKFG